jgi:hypothetical protein
MNRRKQRALLHRVQKNQPTCHRIRETGKEAAVVAILADETTLAADETIEVGYFRILKKNGDFVVRNEQNA